MVAEVPIYTIGYGKRSIEEFIELLQHYQIEFLIDVRSQPYSRYNPSFSKSALEKHLQEHNIQYIFMGDTLGGRPDDESCYIDGKVDYARVREKPFYQQGIARLRALWEKQLRAAIMCSEIKPHECHRGKLISNTLVEQQISVAHIDEFGDLKEQETINTLLTSGQPALFEDLPLVTLHKKIGRSRKKWQ